MSLVRPKLVQWRYSQCILIAKMIKKTKIVNFGVPLFRAPQRENRAQNRALIGGTLKSTIFSLFNYFFY